MTAAGNAARWEGHDAAALAQRWRAARVAVFDSIGSTNDVARDLAESGAPAGTIVIADHQTAGRGRAGRRWQAPPGTSLLLSIVLRPVAMPGPIPLRLGLAIAEALETKVGIRLHLKWPNDLVDPADRKVAGILCEAAGGGGGPYVVAGLGVNVNQHAAEFPADLNATSLRVLAGARVDRTQLADAVVNALLEPRAEGELSPGELARIARRDALRGRGIRTDGVGEGVVEGIAADGALLVRRGGRLERVIAGTVRPLNPVTAVEGA